MVDFILAWHWFRLWFGRLIVSVLASAEPDVADDYDEGLEKPRHFWQKQNELWVRRIARRRRSQSPKDSRRAWRRP